MAEIIKSNEDSPQLTARQTAIIWWHTLQYKEQQTLIKEEFGYYRRSITGREIEKMYNEKKIMFLYEKLMVFCKKFIEKPETSPEDVNNLYEQVCLECQEYIKQEVKINSSYTEVTNILDKTFNHFNLFVGNCKKDSNPMLNVLGEMFEEHSFKDRYLKEPKIKEIYNKGKDPFNRHFNK